MDYHYQLFGLSVVSNVAIPGLTPAAAALAKSDVQIFLGDLPPNRTAGIADDETLDYSSAYLTESGVPSLRIFNSADKRFSHLIYEEGIEFWIDAPSENVWAIWPETFTLTDIATYLLGPAFGIVLRRRCVTCLHASAVAFNGKAFLFSGDAGAGKSTTAAAMARRGHALIADDIVPITERASSFYATPAYPYLSLWPTSVEALFGSADKLPVFSPGFEKRRFSVDDGVHRFQQEAVPIGAIFILRERTSGPDVPRIDDLPMKEGLIALVANSYAARTLGQTEKAHEFELFGRMLKQVPVKRLWPDCDSSKLDELCELIEASCQGS